jgi:hypothetical protein
MKIDERGITLHQSDLKSHCLEQMRLKLITSDPPSETDAATVGTCLHTLIDHELTVQVFDTEADAVAFAAAQYVFQLEKYAEAGSPYSMGTFETHDRALKSLAWLAKSWYHSPERAELCYVEGIEFVSEGSFHLPFMEVDVKKHGKKAETIPVFLAGTMDLVHGGRVYDWKTAGSEYKQWEYQRWGRQPDVYTWAAAQLGLIQPDRDGMYYFDFKVFLRRQEIRLPDTITVKRNANHWAWLEVMVSRLVNLYYNMGTEIGWPLDDQHVLCSDKWCPFWSQCKGALIDPTKGWT